MVLLQSFYTVFRSHRTTQNAMSVLAILASTPNSAFATSGDAGGIPIWVYPVGLLVILGLVKVLQGNKQPASRKRPAATRRKANSTTAARQREKPVVQPQNVQPQTVPTPTVTPAPTIAAPAAAPQPAPVSSIDSQPTTTERAVVETDMKDAIDDAQDYINRERYTEASIILKGAIQQTPERTDLQLKLLEVYGLQQDKQAFDMQYQIVTSTAQPDTILVADSLRPLLTQDPSLRHKAALDVPLVPDLALTGVLPTLTASVQPTVPEKTLAFLEAEFGLDPLHGQPHGQTASVTAAQATTEQTTAPSLEFDIGNFEAAPVKLVDRTALTQDPAHQAPEHAGNLMDFDAITPYSLSLNSSHPEPLQQDDTLNANALFFSQDHALLTPQTPPSAQHSPSLSPAVEFLPAQYTHLLNTLDIQQTNLELADSYLRLGEKQEACELLKEVLFNGTTLQKQHAQQLISKLAS